MIFHIILAAGTGSRFGADLPKQFCLLGEEPVICYTVRAFLEAAADGDIVAVVISPGMSGLWGELAERFPILRQVRMLPVGGSNRVESAYNAVMESRRYKPEIITVHDGARPLVTPDLIRRVVAVANASTNAVIPTVAVTDSLRRISLSNGKEGSVAVDRAQYRAVQTPQAFPATLLTEAYCRADFSDPSLSDDASVVEAAFPEAPAPTLVEGSPDNLKLTRPTDIIIARAILDHRLTK